MSPDHPVNTQTEAAKVDSASMQTEKLSTDAQLTQTESNAVPTDAQLTQTENAVVEESSMQTEEKKTKVLPTQTESKVFNESFMQTDEKTYVDSFMQTDIMCLERFEQICQASVAMSPAGCQTEVESVEQDCQTELVQVDSECQTFKDEQTRDTQTMIKEFSECIIQTDSSMALLVEQDCQASVELCDGVCQAEVEQTESEVQAVVFMQEGECQATVDYCEGECQAVVLQAEGECQATVEMAENECQAVTDQVDGESQVELFYAETECQASVEQQNSECQAGIEQADGACQANPELGEVESQTAASYWLLADNESQTEADEESGDFQFTPVQGGRSVCLQTEAVKIKTKISQTDGICEDVPPEVESKTPAVSDMPPPDMPPPDMPPPDMPPPDMPPPDMPPPGAQAQGEAALGQDAAGEGQTMVSPVPEGHIDPSMINVMNEPGVVQVGLDGQQVGGDIPTIVSIEPVAKPEGEQPSIISIQPVKKEDKDKINLDCKEMSCQTDPVTIIIGDASFLVNRLKDSSSQPARISKNEIEIEVGPEAEKRDLFSFESKRSVRRSIKTEPGKAQARQQTPKTRIKKEKGISPRLPELPVPQEPEPVQRLPPPGSDELGQYSCPFCALTFHESPALYEHLQIDHGNITSSTKVRTPRSAGKGKASTTRARKPVNPPPELEPNDIVEPVEGGDDQGPPILTPYREGEEYSEEAELAAQREQEERQMKMQLKLQKQRAVEALYDNRPPGEDDGPGLFEDIPEPKTKKRKQPREIQQRNKSIFPPIKQGHSNMELDCPMCAEKFGSPDLLYLHIRRYHKDEDNSRKRIDVVNALMHDKLSETPELLPQQGGGRRRRRLPMVATDSTSDSPAKRRRTKEVIEEFEESLIEDMAPAPQGIVERVNPDEEDDNLQDEMYQEEEEEQRVESLVERINPEEEDDQEEHMEGEEQMPSDMLDNMVEVVVQEPGEDQDEGVPEKEELEEAENAEDETANLVEAIAPEDNGIEEENEEHVEEELEAEEKAIMQEEEPEEEENEEVPAEKANAVGLRRTRHSLKGQGPPRSAPRTRGGRRT